LGALHEEHDPRTMQNHLNSLELELIRTGEAEPEHVAHLESCAECQGALEKLASFAAEANAARPAPLAVPPSIDEAILAVAAESRRRVLDGKRFTRRWSWSAAAAAAAVLLVTLAGLWKPWQSPTSPSVRSTQAAAPSADIDGDGSVDIVDALVLARHLEDQQPLKSSWDINRDGRIDQGDVDEVARLVVSVKGARS